MIINKSFGLICALILTSPIVIAAKLLSVNVQHTKSGVRIQCILDDKVQNHTFLLTNNNRIVIDLIKAHLFVDLRHLHVDNKLIQHIRGGYRTPNTLRLVFDINQIVKLKVEPLVRLKSKRYLLTINTLPQTHLDIAKTNNNKTLRNIIIILDPGHGGFDPGAIGTRGTQEKNITLIIAGRLKRIINQQPGMRAILTRNGDYYVGLRRRLDIARKYNADIFISLHADAFIHKYTTGASVFALSQSGATSEAARWLAEKENHSELGGVNLAHLHDQTGLVRTVLIDLSQTATIDASLNLGKNILQRLNQITHLHRHHVEQARFIVLKSPDIPSILIETGFISNPNEEIKLKSSKYQMQLTQSIFEGLKRYFWDHPPHKTSIEALTNTGGKLHYVHKGESLTKIAAQYNLPVHVLQAANAPIYSKPQPGQWLFIPTTRI